MIDLEIKIRRAWPLWKDDFGVSDVENYLKELRETEENIRVNSFNYEHVLFGNDKIIESVRKLISQETKYCEFFIDHQKRILEPDYNKWVFLKKEDIKPLSDWMKPQGEQWIKTNGRVKATIQFDRSGSLVKIKASFENDNEYLNFIDYETNARVEKTAHLKNEENINKKVEEYKTYADRMMGEYIYPRYTPEKNMIDLLGKLLCVNQ